MRWALLIALLALVVAAPAQARVRIKTLSNRADLISGGDALVKVTGARKAVKVTVNGRDVTKDFRKGQGLVTGLRNGHNVVRAGHARLVITNHPKSGPVFAGPQVEPWVCNTQANGLGAPQNAQCDVDPVVTYQYKSTSPLGVSLMPYDPANPPSDVAMTTTDAGKTVPFVVRVETGVIDRGIYRTAALADGWDGKLLYLFGGGTAPQHVQGLGVSVIMYDQLARGYMVASNGLGVHGQNSNDTVNAEALMMLKERIREQNGPIRYTVSEGCSGGGLAQNLIADTYPGLIDGLLTQCAFPDIWSSAPEVHDCMLLTRYFDSGSPQMWLNEIQQAKVLGKQSLVTCIEWFAGFPTFFDPYAAGNCKLGADVVYSAANPGGVRCTLNDYAVSVFGRRPRKQWGAAETAIGRGFANRPLDNVGVQYGLAPLLDGSITAEQFLDVNEKIGGMDIDGLPQAQRTAAPKRVIAQTYRSGQINSGRAMRRVAIIDLRGQDNGEVHQTYLSRAMRARLIAANGTDGNYTMWLSPIPLAGDPSWAFCGAEPPADIDSPALSTCADDSPIRVMDEWLTKVEADKRGVPRAQKVIDDRPAAATDKCMVAGATVPDAVCDFPKYGNARIAAGAPVTNSVIKCRLRPLDPAGYGGRLDSEQFARLQAIFPGGVCDYSKPGVGQQPPKATWLTFAKGPWGRPLGREPRSRIG